jgi:ribosomal protein S27AE
MTKVCRFKWVTTKRTTETMSEHVCGKLAGHKSRHVCWSCGKTHLLESIERLPVTIKEETNEQPLEVDRTTAL